MDLTAAILRRSPPTSDRFLDVFSPPKHGSSSVIAGDELSEDDVLWTGDFSVAAESERTTNGFRSFRRPEKFGILAALPEVNRRPDRSVLCRKAPVPMSSSRILPAVPRRLQELQGREYSQSAPSRKFLQSTPMSVPIVPKKALKGDLADVDLDDERDEEMLPPHEIVARGSAVLHTTTFSVLEGVGRTLKGRDLRQVRNAVWRQTGFLD